LFSRLFEKEKERIAHHLKEALLIEHVGSTAIPGLGGKGIIDIAIGVQQDKMQHICTALQQLGYEFRQAYSTQDRLYFIIYLPDPEEGERRYHIHLTYPESHDWKDLIHFRDYLRAHSEEALEYASLKEKAAAIANQNGDLYRKLKEPIFEKIRHKK